MKKQSVELWELLSPVLSSDSKIHVNSEGLTKKQKAKRDKNKRAKKARKKQRK